jgi:acetyl esterase/lipase
MAGEEMTIGLRTIGRREFLTLAAAGVLRGEEAVMRPVVSQTACPLERIVPVARDGHRGLAFVRTPPGAGPFPAVMIVHGGLVTWPEEQLRRYAGQSALPSRFLAAGYVVATVTYRSRDHDPQAEVSLEDCLAAVVHLKQRSRVDSKSVAVYGCSGGGDLALEIAAATDVCAIAPEEPASVLLTGIYNSSFPKQGARYTPADAAAISQDPKRFYTPEFQKLTRAKLARIHSPILIIQGDVHRINRFNAEVLIPELRAAGKKFEVRTYAGEPHCFCFNGEGPRTPNPGAALKAFNDMAVFFSRHAATKPVALDASVVRLVPVNTP